MDGSSNIITINHFFSQDNKKTIETGLYIVPLASDKNNDLLSIDDSYLAEKYFNVSGDNNKKHIPDGTLLLFSAIITTNITSDNFDLLICPHSSADMVTISFMDEVIISGKVFLIADPKVVETHLSVPIRNTSMAKIIFNINDGNAAPIDDIVSHFRQPVEIANIDSISMNPFFKKSIDKSQKKRNMLFNE